MRTLTVQIKDEHAIKALQALEEMQYIRIVKENEMEFSALPGQPMTYKAFREWIASTEEAPVVDVKDAKALWTNRKKLLQKITR